MEAVNPEKGGIGIYSSTPLNLGLSGVAGRRGSSVGVISTVETKDEIGVVVMKALEGVMKSTGKGSRKMSSNSVMMVSKVGEKTSS